MRAISFKLVFRSWWRNKTYAIISILSLAIGLACTNLLVAFVIHEFEVEAGNPARDRIYYMSQSSPMQSGKRVSFITGDIPPMLKDQYPEVEDYLRFQSIEMNYFKADSTQYEPMQLITVDPSFPRFFPYEVLYGDLNDVLTTPNKIALTERQARLLFGSGDPVAKGATVTISRANQGFYANEKEIDLNPTYLVAAVLKERDQALLTFDALTVNANPYNGGVSLLMTHHPIDTQAFSERLKADKIQGFNGEDSNYRLSTLRESHFQTYAMESISFIRRQQSTLLYVGLASALLILLIACFNYINLNFSRTLQQVRMIHTQRLMGAGPDEITRQLFTDTMLTVFVSFLLSLLITRDLIPLFNSLVSGSVHTAFFFNPQVLPVIVALMLLLATIPALYMSRKIYTLSGAEYKTSFSGKQKRTIVTALSITQYAISIALIMATLTVNNQTRLIQRSGAAYQDLIEIGNQTDSPAYIRPLAEELKRKPNLPEPTLMNGSLVHGGMRQIVIKHPDGSESYYPLMQFSGDKGLLEMLSLQIRKGLSLEKAFAQYPMPAYVNQQFVDLLVPRDENPIGKSVKDYYPDFGSGQTDTPEVMIAGIIDNLYTNSLEEAIAPSITYLGKGDKFPANYLCIRLDGDKKQQLALIEQAWKKVNPGQLFKYTDLYQKFLLRNKRPIALSHLLLMYSLISLFLTCFGLFGTTLYATAQRIKEIGIRKVNGATTRELMWMLNRRFVGWIGLACCLAVPGTWYLLSRWLDGFVYRTEVSGLTCLLSGVIVLVITLLTVSWHSYRAASCNPVKTLRSE
ncbi:MAG: FtsX-like permease family protein [Tannerellaceae bacterium]